MTGKTANKTPIRRHTTLCPVFAEIDLKITSVQVWHSLSRGLANKQGSFITKVLSAAVVAPSGKHLSLLVAASASNILYLYATSDLLNFLRGHLTKKRYLLSSIQPPTHPLTQSAQLDTTEAQLCWGITIVLHLTENEILHAKL